MKDDNGLFEMIKRCKENGNTTTTTTTPRRELREIYYEGGVLKSKPISGSSRYASAVTTDVNKAAVIHNFLNNRR